MSDIKSQILYLEQTLEELKAAQRKNYKREPNHPRNIFKYAIVVPNHPLGIHEHYTDCFENAKKSCIEWATDYGRAYVEDSTLKTVYSVS